MYREEEPSRHNAHILWSQEQFSSADVFDSNKKFCESEGTVSSTSWGFDEFEVKSVQNITSSLSTIESILYDAETAEPVSEELNSECCKWAKAFPHLRIKGQQMTVTVCDSKRLGSQANKLDKSFSEGISTLVPDGIVAVEEISDDTSSSTPVFSNIESEIYENAESRNCVSRSFRSAYIKQRVIEKVALQIWQNVISDVKASREADSFGAKQGARLPPIINVSSSFQQMKAKTKSPLSYNYQKLEGILTVSPKILLPRDEAKVVNEVHQSPKPKTPAKCTTNCCPAVIRLPWHAKISQVQKALRQPLDVEPILLQLTEEETCSCNGLHGTHIELQGKDAKYRFSPFHVPVVPKPPSFLPPIDDIDRLPSSQDLCISTSYESRIRSGSSFKQASIYTRHLNRMSSRPSTSRMSGGDKNSEVKIVDSARGASKKERPGFNLFPVVTSKELTEKKKTCMK